ncbi:hypothetical protein DFJ58DRAFT_764120 [Suillus subalutaceus]|uniref:uncharacterized protein n=1 Tax=Suillus subalutaceus TaxID=48586 RepID=UPI001B879FD9|nr:uncharacterized protein DFJ58DRAFT_764120 [Suillus subalutaceus]KAG1870685.1 hypothetical protein DFJ58DRAFT_764120 [Suillus subalutaceus]
MHRVHKLRIRYLIALCASLRVSASFQYQSAPCLMVSRLSSSLYPTTQPHSSYVSTFKRRHTYVEQGIAYLSSF